MLRRAGHEADHVLDLGMLATPDIEIWRHAEKTGAIILTKDADFAATRIHAVNGPAVVWVRLGNVTNAELEHALKSALPEIVEAIGMNEVLIELR
jgi:predicted nuclease of predicted toxin-antitoxin system